MKFKGLDLNLIVALNALLTEKSVSAAGRKIALSQPATSGALSRLREHFHDELLVPNGRGMALTSFGASLIDPVRRLMVEIEATMGAGAAFDPEQSHRSFRINGSDYVVEKLGVPLTTAVKTAAPGITLEFLRPVSLSKAVEEGTLDLAVGPTQFLSSSHGAELLVHDPYCVVGDKDNPHLKQPLTSEVFFSLPHVSVRLGAGSQPTFAETQVNRQPHKRTVDVITSSFAAIPLLVVGSNRIALLQKSIAASYAERFPIVRLEPPFPIEPLAIMVQHHEATHADGGIQWLKARIYEVAKAVG